jgi:hypothetical protein
MSDLNMTVVVVGFALVIALLTKFQKNTTVPAWMSPLKLGGLVGLLAKMLPWIQKGKICAVVLGYLMVVVLLFNTCLVMMLSGLIKWLFAQPSSRCIEQVA